ncbi:GLPGLI family protein [Ancylomarina euxinus]|uniref:GLPGLI family protein n=1 Tax=Ancylomarina euxinus TaxID=2283627 RepID=A0A425Y834_9BACT|nr:GLPGLI family protein [Ancylomarina euxinus]MCZ4693658.1 GLPGLI family protein [Ancylomarina euxinus]MUP13887.1 GLPGLI family protein [Ancylomarina euxinus]RRG24484.1 GLPGLI family protein [Ancylomarina euxinus]
MKKYCVLVWSLLLSISVFGQDFVKVDTIVKEFYYDYNFQRDSTDSSSEKYQEMVLQVGKKHTKFTSTNTLYKDSLLFVYKDLDPMVALSKIMPEISGFVTSSLCKYVIYKNYPQKGSVQFIGKLGSKINLGVNEEIKLDWQLEEVRDTSILGYTCQKATCYFGGRNYEAWYTMEIPISDGPYKFNGLPGLIVRIADVEKEHVFQLHRVKNCMSNKALIYTKPDKFQTSTARGFVKALKVHFANLYRRYSGNNSITHTSPDGEAKMLRNIRANNNYIERY